MPVSRVWCFGDSTSDNGAGYRLTAELVRRPEAPAEAFVLAGPPAYPDGRFSNGLAAVEVMAAGAGRRPRRLRRGRRPERLRQLLRLDRPLRQHRAARPGRRVRRAARRRTAARPDPDGLFVVQLAGNDYAAWADSDRTTPATVEDVAREMAANECEAVRRLAAAGARRFLVIGPKLVPVCPWEVAAGRTGLAGGFTYALNELLPDELEALRGRLAVDIVFFDLVRAWRRIRVAASRYGLAELDRPFIRTSPDYVPGEGDPDEYFFWDESHVTAAVNRVLGVQLAASLPRDWT